MIPKPLQTPPKWWSPRLSAFWVRAWRPLRRMSQRRQHCIEEIEVRGVEHLKAALAGPQGVLICPNHPGSADPHVMYNVADEVGTPFYFMAAWQLFGDSNWLVRCILRHHGVFSVDREGMDLRAFKQAVDVLANRPHPLVVFPEGEVYHINDRVTPFREGPAAIALSALKRGDRPVSLVPVAIKYRYLEDPTPRLLKIMDDLEQAVLWRPKRDVPLAERIYHFAEGPLALKELEYLGSTQTGPLPRRINALTEFLLQRLEDRHGGDAAGHSVPERIKESRRRIIRKIEELPGGDPARQLLNDDLDDAFFAVQLFSYPGDYVSQSPTIERIAETIDKFAEDVLGLRRASVCAGRKVTISIDEPIAATNAENRRTAAANLTKQLEERVQALLDGIPHKPVLREFAESP
ncbi:MAG: lysophospholipid acyltransferase family protein [Planctomycetaceae bacterium]